MTADIGIVPGRAQPDLMDGYQARASGMTMRAQQPPIAHGAALQVPEAEGE